ncbi:hypothetical protein JD844_004577 [Phrynosoma platyrhinos]|uniref:Myb-like domain-containing protein n=1 Tax=Phrynosoma platyrhinos TaxID=52577 RepID=A0ABQ7SDI7_PHRPL|nr:hypothetical protein JD844_004577 [Phrynosoma platyrhinos]
MPLQGSQGSPRLSSSCTSCPLRMRFGKFSKEENKLLRKNVEAFLKESGIDSAEKLLFTDRFPEEQANLKRLKREHLFGLKIAQGIPRPWRLVYYRARKMFDSQNYNGKYSEKEKKKLRKYQTLYGNNWKKMSELMGRSSHSLQLKYYDVKSGDKLGESLEPVLVETRDKKKVLPSQPKETIRSHHVRDNIPFVATGMDMDPFTAGIGEFNSGAWSREETKKLLDTLKEILRAKVDGLDSTLEPKNMNQAMLLREHLYKDIPWFRVEAKVGTRGWKQCKRKWLSIVTKKMSRGKTRNHGLENLKFKIDIIERLYELNVEDIDDIDWEDLSHIIGNVPPDYVRNRFYKIKSMYVPYWNTKTFPETIEYLHKKILPKLRSKLAGKETKEVATGDRNWKRVFQFNEIFQDDNDLIDEEEEEEAEE